MQGPSTSPTEPEATGSEATDAKATGSEATDDFRTTIPRELVHKAGPEAVWLTRLSQVADSRYVGVGQVPRAHVLINDSVPPLHTYDDLSLLAELGRQVGIGSMHAFEGVPTNWATVFMKFELELSDPRPHAPPDRPVPAVTTLEIDNRVRGDDGIVTDIAGTTTFEIDGEVRAVSTSLAAARPKGPYREWRREMRAEKPLQDHPPVPPEPVDPARVARRDPDNVLVGELQPLESPRRLGCRVRVDLLHPHFFEHPIDHVPGVLHLEAARQAALVAAGEVHGLPPAGAVVTRCRTRFRGFAELELPLDASVDVGDVRESGSDTVEVPVRVELSQPGDVVSAVDLTLRGRR